MIDARADGFFYRSSVIFHVSEELFRGDFATHPPFELVEIFTAKFNTFEPGGGDGIVRSASAHRRFLSAEPDVFHAVNVTTAGVFSRVSATGTKHRA